jgi:serine/threonine protein kinase
MASAHSKLEPLSPQDPDRIGSYALLGRLGSGAMGRVYLGRSASGRLFAVKTIRREFADEADFRARFAREVKAAGRVSGVFTAAVVASDPEAAIPWLATAYIPAPSLEQLVEVCGPLPVPALRWLAAGCAEALESIHEAGLVHRDLKPSNVLVSMDGPRVIDFGVARAAERPTVTATHQAVGTPAYMAPEQARDSKLTVAASDVFSLGATLVYAATGHPPYAGESVTDMLVRLATEAPDLSDLPEEISELITDCLQRDPAARPTASELLTHLAVHLEEADGGYELRAAPLPGNALALLEEYRREPRSAETGEDATFASRTSVRRNGVASSKPPPEQEQDQAERDTAPDHPSPWGGRGGRVIVIAVAAAGVAATLVAGVALDRTISHPPPPDRDRGAGGPPPDGGQPGAPQGAPPNVRTSGPPKIVVNQPMGDKHSGFVIHGSGMTPGQVVTVRLDKLPRASPVMPIVDRAGTFNYVINQSHEFFTGSIPPGEHHVTVTLSGSSKLLRVPFSVNNL